jgi:hypothetical protein
LYEDTLGKLNKARDSVGRVKRKENTIKLLRTKLKTAENEMDSFKENYSKMITELGSI